MKKEWQKEFDNKFDGDIINDGINPPYISLFGYDGLYSVDGLLDKVKQFITDLRRDDSGNLAMELIRLNTIYQKDFTSPKAWIMTQHDIDNPLKIPTEDELTQRHIGAVTILSEIYNFIKDYYAPTNNK